ncbi:STAS domain-containing protein [Streptomyces sp. NPDC017890]|uniref:STAS domain-containing protein n=1 Tax=Streptomyces sp. NPDC017890 TaxID=3365015 RepID=UPI00378B7AD5
MREGGGIGERSAGQAGLREWDGAAVVQYEWRDAWVVVARGSYDMHSITPLADALDTAATEHRKVVLDASGITFADSTLLNLLILTHRTTDLRVAAPTQQLRRILELTGVDTVLKVGATVEEAAAC